MILIFLGKTLTARIIASKSNLPLVYVSPENIVHPLVGMNERNIAAVFDSCDEMDGLLY